MRSTLAAVCVVAACGRVDFEQRAADAGTSRPGVDASSCPLPTTAADPVTIRGKVFYYTNTNNGQMGIAMATVTALTGVGGSVIAQTSSGALDANNESHYTLTIPTGGVPRPIVLEFSAPNYYPTTEIPDRPIDHDLDAMAGQQWVPGDGPMWNSGTLGYVYTVAAVTRVSGTGTLNVLVTDCAGAPIDGATVSIAPLGTNGVIEYLDATGAPAKTQATTLAPYSYALALNVDPNTVAISAQAPGHTFTDQTIQVLGDQDMMAVIRANE